MKKIPIKKADECREYDADILSVSKHADYLFKDHCEVARAAKGKDPYVVIVILENLDPKFWNNKKYVKKTGISINTLWEELLLKYFFEEFGDRAGNALYGEWLSLYKDIWKTDGNAESIDDYIIKREFESRYGEKILAKYKDKERLFRPRMRTQRDRYYTLPHPLDRVDWRSPFDAIFVWNEEGKKVCFRGGTGSSGAREQYSKGVYGFSLINKEQPVQTFVFRYGKDNVLSLIETFPSLTVPQYEIGCNYDLKAEDASEVLSTTHLMEWGDFYSLQEIVVE